MERQYAGLERQYAGLGRQYAELGRQYAGNKVKIMLAQLKLSLAKGKFLVKQLSEPNEAVNHIFNQVVNRENTCMK